MALRRCTKNIDGTIPIPALLYEDEELLASQDKVGIYDGQQKSPDHQAGSIHVSSHRLFYVDQQDPESHSFSFDLSSITNSVYYSGLFKSSPKVTLSLSPPSTSQASKASDVETEIQFETWECEVCGHKNPPGLSPAASRICTLCGVPRSSVPSSAPINLPVKSVSSAILDQHISSSLPSSSRPSVFSSPATPSSRTLVRKPSTIACPACTFLNHPSLRNCELCSTPLPSIQVSKSTQNPTKTKSAPSTRPASPDISEEEDDATSWTMRISFRGGGDKAFYAVLKRAVLARGWEVGGSVGAVKGKNPVLDPNESGQQVGKSGITAILRNVESSAQNNQTNMDDAFKDLEAFSVKAKDMVRMAADLNERLTASIAAVSNSSTSDFISTSQPTEPEEATFIRSSLTQLGLQLSNAPVTLDTIKDERRWVEELAKELALVLQGNEDVGHARVSIKQGPGIMRDRGIVALDEVWGGWNRARGVALIPPSTFLSVVPHLPNYTSPTICTRTFPSGLTVLHTPPYTQAAFAARLVGLLSLAGSKTTVDIAQEERMTIGLAEEMILAVEQSGDVCRDDASSMIKGGSSGTGVEVRWCRNIFNEYTWDGQ